MKAPSRSLLAALAAVLAACAPAGAERAAQTQTAQTQTAQIRTVTVQQLHAALPAPVVDVRTPAEFAAGHVAGAVNIPLEQVAARAAEVPHGAYVFCRSGSRSLQAARTLKEQGREVANVSGGVLAWERAGYPLEQGAL